MNQHEYIYYACVGDGQVLAIPARDDDEVNNIIAVLGLTARRIWLKDYSE